MWHTQTPWYQLDMQGYAEMKAVECPSFNPKQSAAPTTLLPGVDHDPELDLHHMVCVPIWLGNRVVAALQLINRLPDPDDATRPRRFTQEDEARCERGVGTTAKQLVRVGVAADHVWKDEWVAVHAEL